MEQTELKSSGPICPIRCGEDDVDMIGSAYFCKSCQVTFAVEKDENQNTVHANRSVLVTGTLTFTDVYENCPIHIC